MQKFLGEWRKQRIHNLLNKLAICDIIIDYYLLELIEVFISKKNKFLNVLIC
jgi:hypothetical protein